MSWIITGTEAGNLGLLDQYGGAAAAYSLRNLSVYYTDPVVRVRRSSDNTEQDFTAAQITDGTLTAFCGAGNGFVRTWYDQSGNGKHANQSNSSKQPQIVENSSVVNLNSLQGLRFSSSSSTSLSAFPAETESFSTTVVFSTNSSSIEGLVRNEVFNIYGFLITNNYGARISTSGSNTAILHNSTEGIKNLYFYDFTGSFVSLRYNGASAGSAITSSYTAAPIPTVIGASPLGGEYFNGIITEIVYYPNSQLSSAQGIEANINAHYSIF